MEYHPSNLRDAIVLCSMFAMMFAVGWGCCMRYQDNKRRQMGRKLMFVARFVTVDGEPTFSLN